MSRKSNVPKTEPVPGPASVAPADLPRAHADVLAASTLTPVPPGGGVWWFDEVTQMLVPGERPVLDSAEGGQP